MMIDVGRLDVLVYMIDEFLKYCVIVFKEEIFWCLSMFFEDVVFLISLFWCLFYIMFEMFIMEKFSLLMFE